MPARRLPYLLCKMSVESYGSMITRRSTEEMARAVGQILADKHQVQVGLWDERRQEYVQAWQPRKTEGTA